MSVVEDVFCISRLWVIVLYVTCEFLVTYSEGRLVWPTYASLQVLHVNEYTPLMSCGLGEDMVVVSGLVSCSVVLLLLKVTLTFVFLNILVIFLTCGEECVKVAHFVSCMEAVGWGVVGWDFSVYCVLILLEGGWECCCCVRSVWCFSIPCVVLHWVEVRAFYL